MSDTPDTCRSEECKLMTQRRIRRDGHGLYVRTGGYVFRPLAQGYVVVTRHHEHDMVHASHVAGTQRAKVGWGVNAKTWHAEPGR